MHANGVVQQVAELLERAFGQRGIAPDHADHGVQGVEQKVRIELCPQCGHLGLGAQCLGARRVALPPRANAAPTQPGVRHRRDRYVDERAQKDVPGDHTRARSSNGAWRMKTAVQPEQQHFAGGRCRHEQRARSARSRARLAREPPRPRLIRRETASAAMASSPSGSALASAASEWPCPAAASYSANRPRTWRWHRRARLRRRRASAGAGVTAACRASQRRTAAP